ncbi:MAG TPA: hypothetical protein VD996_07440 [Chitinophagaceae bacterium]|nr:hypothetical protein [Chitinophagaceae bacterium]
MKKFRMFFGAAAVSLAVLFITKADAASERVVFPLCEESPNDACLYRWDPDAGPIYLIDYRPR